MAVSAFLVAASGSDSGDKEREGAEESDER